MKVNYVNLSKKNYGFIYLFIGGVFLKHRFLPNIPIYWQCVSCGYVDEFSEGLQNHLPECQGCKKQSSEYYEWFPDIVYDYAILLEDYHFRQPTLLRQEYLKTVAIDNAMQYWCSSTEPEFRPTNDLKPITILLFRTIFEILIKHFLWKHIYVSLLPSPDAERYASFILNKDVSVSNQIKSLYPFVTGNKWRIDLDKLGYSRLNNLLIKTAQVRNEFIHENPYSEHEETNLAEQARNAIPELFACFVKLANLHIHPRCLQLSKRNITKEE